VNPILSKAVTGLQKLNKCDINELKSMKHPPQAIVNLLAAVCIILKVEPKLVPIAGVYGAAQYTKDYWSSAIGTQVLGSKNIVEKLGSIDPTQLDVEIMTKLEGLMDSGSFAFV
jgi:hypothetical protein